MYLPYFFYPIGLGNRFNGNSSVSVMNMQQQQSRSSGISSSCSSSSISGVMGANEDMLRFGNNEYLSLHTSNERKKLLLIKK